MQISEVKMAITAAHIAHAFCYWKVAKPPLLPVLDKEKTIITTVRAN